MASATSSTAVLPRSGRVRARHRPKDCRRLLNRICDEGVVIKLDGAKPTNYAGRTSYAPSVLYNGGEGE